MNTVENARGRWRDILPRLGVDHRFLVNKHGPCPICGGKDRYRFDDKGGSGSFYCNQCGPGSGIILLRKLHGWDFKTACSEIDKLIGDAPAPVVPKPKAASESPETRRRRMEQTLRAATDSAVVERYLNGRGLKVAPALLRGHPGLPYFDGDQLLGYYRTMLAPVVGPDGKTQSVHRTYLTNEVPKRKKLLPAVDTVRGAAVRLFEAGPELGCAEGIETAIAAHELFNVPVWAVISASIMENFVPPAGTNRLCIFADHDRNFAGQKAAYVLANKLACNGLAVSVLLPSEPGTDWLDQLNSLRTAP